MKKKRTASRKSKSNNNESCQDNSVASHNSQVEGQEPHDESSNHNQNSEAVQVKKKKLKKGLSKKKDGQLQEELKDEKKRAKYLGLKEKLDAQKLSQNGVSADPSEKSKKGKKFLGHNSFDADSSLGSI